MQRFGDFNLFYNTKYFTLTYPSAWTGAAMQMTARAATSVDESAIYKQTLQHTVLFTQGATILRDFYRTGYW